MITFIEELRQRLATSDAKLRRYWAERMVDEGVDLHSLMSLLHDETGTAQRFTWFIGDLLAADPDIVVDCVPMLFALRNEMPFPGMRRSVAKALWIAGIPDEIETEAISQLFDWLEHDEFEIGCKHYASKALFDLVVDGRADRKRLDKILKKQESHATEAHQCRMAKLRMKLGKLE